MEFSCNQCDARYALPDERVRGKRIRTKCRKCGGEILLDGTAGAEQAPPSLRLSAPPKPRPSVRPSAPPSSATGPRPPPPAAPVLPVPARPEPGRSPGADPGAIARDFGFDDEATAVFEPDRARELLEREAARTDDASSETPLSFGFDDESTKLVDTRNALGFDDESTKLVDTRNALGFDDESTNPTSASRPDDESTKVFEPERAEALMGAHLPPPSAGRVEAGPSIVLDEALGAAQPKPKAPKPTPSRPAPARQEFPRELAAIQNEPTRVVRLKKKRGAAFWAILLLALAAAVAGGFVALHLLGYRAMPRWHGLP